MPPMSPLPVTRLSEAPAFARTGLDYFGPLFVKCFGEKSKVWVCLFTCLVTRAIHLEMVEDMTTEQFLLCFRRFISQRGTPLEIISDNAAQFKTANNTLDSLWSEVTLNKEVQSYVSKVGVTWKFIVEMASWMGGFYERLVGIVKRAFRKGLGRTLYTVIQMQTIIKEIEAVVNARPLVYVGDDLNSTITPTPQHFLTLNPKTGIPDIELDIRYPLYRPCNILADKLLEKWKKGQKLLNSFWKIWRDEYLLSIRERQQTKLKSKRVQASSSPNVGDVVIIKDDLPRGCWKLGKIINLIHSSDQLIRSAKVQTSSGRVIGRPLNLLYPIECQRSTDNSDITIETKYPLPITSEKRVKRKAAATAMEKNKHMDL